MLDVGGQDATEAFEDVGHSDEARETLEQLLVGTLKRQVSLSDPSPSFSPSTPSPPAEDSGLLTPGPPSQQPGDPQPKASQPANPSGANTSSAGMGSMLYAVVLVGGLVAFGAYQYMQSQQAATESA